MRTNIENASFKESKFTAITGPICRSAGFNFYGVKQKLAVYRNRE